MRYITRTNHENITFEPSGFSSLSIAVKKPRRTIPFISVPPASHISGDHTLGSFFLLFTNPILLERGENGLKHYVGIQRMHAIRSAAPSNHSIELCLMLL